MAYENISLYCELLTPLSKHHDIKWFPTQGIFQVILLPQKPISTRSQALRAASSSLSFWDALNGPITCTSWCNHFHVHGYFYSKATYYLHLHARVVFSPMCNPATLGLSISCLLICVIWHNGYHSFSWMSIHRDINIFFTQCGSIIVHFPISHFGSLFHFYVGIKFGRINYLGDPSYFLPL